MWQIDRQGAKDLGNDKEAFQPQRFEDHQILIIKIKVETGKKLPGIYAKSLIASLSSKNVLLIIEKGMRKSHSRNKLPSGLKTTLNKNFPGVWIIWGL